MEDYLKNIFILERENRVARVSDISRRMNVRKASVVSAVALLQKCEMLMHEKYGFITLTDKGRLDGEILRKKYTVLHDIFVKDLKMDEEKAGLEACAAEHVLSADTVTRIKALAKTARKAAQAEKQKMRATKTKKKR